MKAHRSNNTRAALTLVEVLVVGAILVLLAVLVLPPLPLARASGRARATNCGNNLRQGSLAFQLWAGDFGDQYPMSVSVTDGGTKEWVESGLAWPHFLILSNELNTPKVLSCPLDVHRGIATNWSAFDNASLSYFVGVDAAPNNPAMLLTGERLITRDGVDLPAGLTALAASQQLAWSVQSHRERGLYERWAPQKGHVVLVGSPEPMPRNLRLVDSHGLRKLLANTGVATNRLAMP